MKSDVSRLVLLPLHRTHSHQPSYLRYLQQQPFQCLHRYLRICSQYLEYRLNLIDCRFRHLAIAIRQQCAARTKYLADRAAHVWTQILSTTLLRTPLNHARTNTDERIYRAAIVQLISPKLFPRKSFRFALTNQRACRLGCLPLPILPNL